MRVSREKLEKTLDKLDKVITIITAIFIVEDVGAIICYLMDWISQKAFRTNWSCFLVVLTLFIIVDMMKRNLKLEKRHWEDIEIKRYKYTNVKWFNLTEEIVTCVNNGADETFEFDLVYAIVPEPEDETPVSSYVTKEVCKMETRFLWWIVEDEKTKTRLCATEEEYNREKALEDEEKEERKRQAEEAVENEYQIIC